MKRKKILNFLLSFIIMFFSVLSRVVIVEGEEITDVLTDLKADKNFNENEYPVIEDDYSINVIQIGESSNKELYIYTYQPSNGTKDLIASSINISWSINENLKYRNYNLKFCNKSGVFNKYLVNGFVVKSDMLRYYDISEIFRPFDFDLDNDAGHDNSISEIGLSVSQLWSASTVNGEVSYCMVKTDVVTITDKFVGFLRYFNGFNFFSRPYTESHFVAFSTDYKIDSLEEVQIGFNCKDYTYIPSLDHYNYGDSVFCYSLTIKSSDEVKSDNKNWLAVNYSWKRIQSRDDFLNDEKDILSEDSKTALAEKQFVLRFYETEFTEYNAGDSLMKSVEGQFVDDVTLFRLKFRTNGVSYNLGVVDSKQTGSRNPSGVESGINDLQDIVEKILGLLVLVILVVLIWPIIIAVLPFIISVFKNIFKFIFWVLGAPFRLLRKRKK